jgi:WhiB family redox-sensing transcriptional regulator
MAEVLMPTAASHQDGYWFLRGACRSSDLPPDSWFPRNPIEADATAAKRVCRRCPVIEQCAREAFEGRNEFGIWGGQDERERRQELRRAARA